MAKQTRKAGVPAKVTTIVKKVITKQEKPVKKYPYYVDNEEYDEHPAFANMMEDKYDDTSVDEGTDYGFSKVIDEKGDEVFFSYEVSAAVHTCGFLELGELSASSSDKNLLHLADLLDGVVSFANGCTLFMNTNGAGHSKILEKALPLSKHWVKVKTYKNPRSGNILTLWVTNN